MAATYKHAVTGRVVRVREDSRMARLVEADENYTEVKTSTGKKEASDGSGNAGGRGAGTRKGAQSKRGRASSKSAD